MNCANCGKELKPGAKFCVSCGTPATAAAPAPPSATSVPNPPPATGVPAPPARQPGPPPSRPQPEDRLGVPQPPPEIHPEDVWTSTADAPARAISLPRWAYLAAGGVFLFILAAGIVMHFREIGRTNPHIAGKYEIKGKRISLLFPRKGWHASLGEQADAPAGVSEFTRDGGVELKITSAEIPAAFPPDIPDEKIAENEKGFVKQAEKLVAGEGFMFTENKFAPYSSGGAIGAALEGTASRGKDKRNAYLYILFRGNASYYFLFLFPDKTPPSIRDEAGTIVDTLNFLDDRSQPESAGENE